MPKIPILKAPYKNVDEVAVLEGGTELIDGYFDETGALNRRWGLWSWWSAGGLPGIDGLFWWKDKQTLIVVGGGRAYAFTSYSSAPIEITTQAVRLLVGNKVRFASTDSMLFMANGDRIVQWNGGTEKAGLISDPLAPTRCRALAIASGYLLAAEDGTQLVHITEAIETTDTSVVWKPTWFTANSNSDAITQILVGWDEVSFIGPYSMEVWRFTGVEETETDVPFARLDGAAIERGCIAPDSALIAFNTQWWLDHERRVIRMESRTPKIISTPIDRFIRNLDRVDDCRSFQLDRWVVFTFPHDNVTWVFDTYTESWTRWGKWNETIKDYDAYLGQDCVYVPEWSQYFIAGRKEGRVLLAHPRLVTDISEPIRMLYRSAHYDHGTMARKRSDRFMMRLKRGS